VPSLHNLKHELGKLFVSSLEMVTGRTASSEIVAQSWVRFATLDPSLRPFEQAASKGLPSRWKFIGGG
jgi:hypothetical protein